jgi:microcystin-dependent protein
VSSPFVGEIRMFAGNFAPVGWAFCDGQIMQISENETLFNLIGTTYGGDGQSTFALPNLQSRIPVHVGPGFAQAQTGGAESVTLTTSQIPGHNHSVNTTAQAGTTSSPSGAILADEGPLGISTVFAYKPFDGTSQQAINNATVGQDGGSQPHDNMVPFLAVNFIISLFGVFPSQS